MPNEGLSVSWVRNSEFPHVPVHRDLQKTLVGHVLAVDLGDHHDRLPKLPRPARFGEMGKALPGHPLKAAPTCPADVEPDALRHRQNGQSRAQTLFHNG